MQDYKNFISENKANVSGKLTQDKISSDLENIRRVVSKFVSRQGCNTGSIDFFGFDNLANIQTEIHVENDGKLGYDIVTVINQTSKYAKNLKMEETAGRYDWKADHYIRPTSIITFHKY